MTKLIVGCNYHTIWQREKGMRFVLESYNLETGKCILYTRNSKRKFETTINSLIFIETKYNIYKSNKIIKTNENT